MRLLELDTVDESLASQVPERIMESIEQFVWYGRPTGGFLGAVFCNDLFGAIGRADHESLASIGTICKYIYNAVPSVCYGKESKVAAHIERGRKRIEAMENGTIPTN